MNCDTEPDYEAMSGLLVAVIDQKHPELLAGAWDWSKLDGEEWSLLLQDRWCAAQVRWLGGLRK